MSAVDSYKHRCVGIVHCPSRHEIVPGRSHNNVAVYILEEEVPEGEEDFAGKKGDILVGGGSGECGVLRISLPEAFQYEGKWKAYWTMNDAFLFGDGYSRLGWTPAKVIESWITDHILAFLSKENPSAYPLNRTLNEDGSICRRPTGLEQSL